MRLRPRLSEILQLPQPVKLLRLRLLVLQVLWLLPVPALAQVLKQVRVVHRLAQAQVLVPAPSQAQEPLQLKLDLVPEHLPKLVQEVLKPVLDLAPEHQLVPSLPLVLLPNQVTGLHLSTVLCLHQT